MDYVFVNGNFYGFVTNYKSGNLLRLDFGNSLLNNPSFVNLGNFNNTIPNDGGAGGIQVIQHEGNWYAWIVAGYPPGGSNPRLIRIKFGNNITNTNPVVTNMGNIGNMYDPKDLVIINENGQWYGFTVNAETNTITRFDFTSSFENIPSATNLSNIGNLLYPTGIFATEQNGIPVFFITNGGDNTRIGGKYSITRLNFNSGVNALPDGINLGNVGNTLQHPRDITLMDFCDRIYGTIINAHPFYNDFLYLNFENSITNVPTGKLPAEPNVLDFPYSFTDFINVGEELVGFVINKGNNSISRVKFANCNDANPGISNDAQPEPVLYNRPGNYTVSLVINKGLPNESVYCKDVVVKRCSDEMIINSDTTLCVNQQLAIRTYPAVSYQWSPASGLDNATAANPIASPQQTTKYYVDALLPDNSSIRDSITITVLPAPVATVSNDTIICRGAVVPLQASGGNAYLWTPSASLNDSRISNPISSATENITYRVFVSATNGCSDEDSVRIQVRPYPNFSASGDLSICVGEAALLTATGGDRYNWSPVSLVSDPQASTTSARPSSNTIFSVTISEQTCQYDTTIHLPVEIHNNPVVTATSSNDIDCTTPTSQLMAQGASSYTWSPATGLDNSSIPNPISFVETNTVYQVIGTDEFGCTASATVEIKSEKAGEPGFVLPNAFTPNNDGRNDCFGIKRWGSADVQLFTIYNRWGKIVFQTKDPGDCWDGKFNQKPQPQGGYCYVILANTFCGPVKRTGMITLIR